MSVINILSPHVADLIAAGEVVERPASVIKELIENAFDAGAKNVVCEIRNGGMTYIRVTDDGCGMAPEDAGIAFTRHATSKLSGEAGLERISTMGFRGEALAAISSVSHIELLTRQKGADEGTRVLLDAGDIQDMTPCGCPEGTTMIVRDLFFNTPARQKFMKTDRSESSACITAALRCALGRPDVSLRMVRDGTDEFFSPGDGRIDSCLYALLGREETASMLQCTSSSEGLTVKGYIGSPSDCRGNRAHQFFFVNNRFIKSQLLQTALEQAYKNSLLTGRYPSCALYLEIPYGTVDVNVHPAKTEIRFGSEKTVFDFVYQAAKFALEAENRLVSTSRNTCGSAAGTSSETSSGVSSGTASNVSSGSASSASSGTASNASSDTTPGAFSGSASSTSSGTVVRTSSGVPAEVLSGGSPLESAGSTCTGSGEDSPVSTGSSIKETPAVSPSSALYGKADSGSTGSHRTFFASPQASYGTQMTMNLPPERSASDAGHVVPDSPCSTDSIAVSAAFAESPESHNGCSELRSPSANSDKSVVQNLQNGYETACGAASGGSVEKIVENSVQNVENSVPALYKILGEAFRTYIIVEQNGEILLIDKHAAHERMIFDRLRQNKSDLLSQMLLTPETVKLSHEDSELVEQNSELLARLGFEIDQYGENVWIVRGAPASMVPGDAAAAVEEICDRLKAGNAPDPAAVTEEILHTVACKAAIKAGWDTQPRELEEIVSAVCSGKIRYCPHGRPVSVVITRSDLDKLFKRIV